MSTAILPHVYAACCSADATLHVPLTCNVPELSTVALRAPEGAVAAAWFKRSDSPRPLCVGSERCVLYAATRGDAGLYYGAAPGSSRSTSANKYFVRVNVLSENEAHYL